MVFDKNGTITYGALSVASVCVLKDSSTGMVMSLATFLAVVSTVENYSEPLLATAVVRFSKMMLGQGVVGNKEHEQWTQTLCLCFQLSTYHASNIAKLCDFFKHPTKFTFRIFMIES